MASNNIDTREFIASLEELAKEKRINKDILFGAIENALVSAYKKNYGKSANVRAEIDRTTGKIEVLVRKTVVDEVADPLTEISLEEARRVRSIYEVGDLIETSATPRDFGRIAAQTAKQVVVQHIREAERGVIYEEYIEKESEILTAIVQHIDGKMVCVDIGRTLAIMDAANQIPGETYRVNDRLKVYVLEVARGNRGPQVMVSRTHQGLVKRLFELEVPEIRSGVVQIRSIAREAGSRTKMAVFSTDKMIDPVGSCVGPHGIRVENVVNELRTEKIDIVKWSSDPAEYIASALSPARVLNVYVNEKEKMARVIVPDNQLSLAIGKEGQNVRLAAKLTGWKIDLKSQSQMMQDIATEIDEFPLPEGESEI
ncbi:MAG: transcription termination factor NusA [Christensenellales bacterium]|jgi:N utilization substance protein A